MTDRILPVSATPLELHAEQASAEVSAAPVPLRQLWDPDTCPLDLLPYLAWAFSVDRWDETWDEATKRGVIRQSYFVHRHKGTIGALRRAVEPMGYLISVTEWWQNGKAPGTFEMVVGTLDTGITPEMYAELERVINDTKPCSRHLTTLAISLETRGDVFVSAASYDGDTMTIYPYMPDAIETTSPAMVGAALHVIDTMEIFP
ncbi:phage tail protein I [Serratia marcescens]|uniref:Phage tail protein I n=1 Tax=Serratia marcescens TaxID=615 RepID=A0A5C7CE13_SERMA|nr:phage tail protein I [Serratia marcescens]TXE33254.1 phage tail protein I [Serratia marcescens]TXE65222.1 phage tail protein I [Serratia marcescens]